MNKILFFLYFATTCLRLSAETIVIGSGDWPPYMNEKDKNQGIAIQIIKESFARQGIEAKFVFLPWARSFEDAKNGKIDASGVWLKNAEREKDFYYSDAVINEQHGLFYLKEIKFNWNQVSDLKKYIFGGLENFSYGLDIDQAIVKGDIKIERVKDDNTNFKKILAKRIGLYPQEINVGKHILNRDFKKDEVKAIVSHPKLINVNPSYLIFSKKNKNSLILVRRFNLGLKDLIVSGRYNKIYKSLEN